MKTKLLARSFTLIEILVVVMIIGLLATVIVLNMAGARAKGRDARRKSDLNLLVNALDAYNRTTYAYPSSNGDAAPNSCSTRPCVSYSTPADPAGPPAYFSAETATPFIGSLMPNYINKVPTDPINKINGTYSSWSYTSGTQVDSKSYFYLYSVSSSSDQFKLACKLEDDPNNSQQTADGGSNIFAYEVFSIGGKDLPL
jgi:prepilin-type N-terminal cleavage/methylation domain-containing protein